MLGDDDDCVYRVVRNIEDQYSVWPADRVVPPGWEGLEVTGTRAACLAHIGDVWTDMRPKSLRDQVPR